MRARGPVGPAGRRSVGILGVPRPAAALRALAWLVAGAALAASTASAAPTYTPAAQADRVPSMPGATALDANMFAGYVNATNTARLFYIHVEARPSAPADAPLILWLNGGPGCSSVGTGFMEENGPWFAGGDGKSLVTNPYSWHGLAHMVWLEAPETVGFSYSTVPLSSFDDASSAAVMRGFLLGFLARFPHLAAKDFYVAGESFAGHYIPTLSLAILGGNQGGPGSAGFINLKGFFLGNPWASLFDDQKAGIDFQYYQAMMSTDLYKQLNRRCRYRRAILGAAARVRLLKPSARAAALKSAAARGDESAIAAIGGGDASASAAGTSSPRILFFNRNPCYKALYASWDQTGYAYDAASSEVPNTNWYGIYAPTCAQDQGNGLDTSEVCPRDNGCMDNAVSIYLNTQAVQDALHASGVPRASGWTWQTCSDPVFNDYSENDFYATQTPKFKQLLGKGLKMWVISGQLDGVCPTIGTRAWIEGLNLPVDKDWRPWATWNGQVGGWRVDYTGMTLAVVRGAGHMVPNHQPMRAYQLLATYLYGAAASGMAPPTPPQPECWN